MQREDHRMRRVEIGLVAGLVLLAGWLRLGQLELVEFKGDEALTLQGALRIAEGSHFPLAGGRSSLGMTYPALFGYLLAPLALITIDPVGFTAFFGLFNILAVFLLYRLLRPRFGPFVALSAAALLATAPWPVLHSRKIWSPDVFPLLMTLLLACLLRILEQPRSRAVVALPVLLCVAWQSHFSALCLAGLVVVVLLYAARRLRWSFLALGAGLAILLLLPYLVHEARNDWIDFKLLLGLAGNSAATSPSAAPKEVDELLPVVFLIRLASALGWDYVTGASAPAFEQAAPLVHGLVPVASGLIAVLMLGAVGLLVLRLCWQIQLQRAFPFLALDRAEESRALVLVWWLGIVGFYELARLPSHSLHPHHFICSYPVQFVLVALGLDFLRKAAPARFQPAATRGAAVLVVALVVYFCAFNLEFRRFLRRHGGTLGDYGVAYVYKDAVARHGVCHGVERVAADRGAREVPFLMGLHRAQGGLPAGACAGAGEPASLLQVRNRLGGAAAELRCRPERFDRFGPLETCLHP